MKMPSTTNAKAEVKASPDMGDTTKQCINCLEKKVRNLEKRKTRIEQNQEKAKKGSKLEKEQEVSLRQYEQVTHDLEFARDLHKQFQQIISEHEKMSKKQAKREKIERQAQEIKRIGEILQLQSLLDLLGGDQVREDFKTGQHGAVILSEDSLNQLDELYQEISPSREEGEYSERLMAAAEHLVALLDGKDREVLGTTYKEMKGLITRINECGYFDKVSETKAQSDAPEADQEVEKCDPEPEAVVETEDADEVDEENDDELEQPDTLNEQQQQQEAIDLSVEHEIQTQKVDTLEQDAFFTPSSSTYQSDHDFSQQSNDAAQTTVPQQTPPDFQSFTNNRPFQFIQTSYVMPEVAADPAVIAAQPAGASGLQFMSQSYESSSQQPAQAVNQQSDLSRVSQQQGAQPTQTPKQSQDFAASQSFAQSDSRYPAVDDVTSSGMMVNSHSPYEIPPSIPMPPSKMQEQNQLDQQAQDQQSQEKKFQMNASAPVFQSMFNQGAAQGPGSTMPVSVPPPSAPATTGALSEQTGMPTSDFLPQQSNTQNNGSDFGPQSGAAGDFHQVYSGNGFNGNFTRGGRGNFRGGRGGSASNGNMRNGGGSGLQNGFNNRGPGGPGNNSGRGNRGNYQGFPPNSNYRPDGFQGGYNGNSGGSAGGFGGQVFSKRTGGGMGGASGAGYNRGGGGGGSSNMQRGGATGMRGGGMPRGGGGQGGPRGAPRGGQYNRPTAAQ